jgi:Protein of unknown function (DUF1203)
MPAFTVSPLPASLVDQARSAALADGTAVEVTSNEDAPFPVRCCLHDATAEEGVLLLSMQPRSGDSPYAAPGPVYIHRNRCTGYSSRAEVPQILRGRTLSLRGYTDEHMITGTAVVAGDDVERAAQQLLDVPGTAYLFVHFAGPGCYACRIDPAA